VRKKPIRRPTFFIVGAPRCGTAAMRTYLGAHPNVFLPRATEPHFFVQDLRHWPAIRDPDEYAGLFEAATDQHLAIGEASPMYLFSRLAASKIREFDPQARLIAMCRNTVDFLCSVHNLFVFNGTEDELDFERAWRLQDERKRGLHVPATCPEPSVLQYRELGKLGAQVERLLSVFPREQVHFILLEDLAADARREYEKVLSFLGLPSDGRSDFPRVNPRMTYKVEWLNRLLFRLPPRLLGLWKRVKKAMGIKTLGILSKVQLANTKPVRRKTIRPEFKQELVSEFREDIGKLAGVLGRDLTHWCS
jgi:hypothetical protein